MPLGLLDLLKAGSLGPFCFVRPGPRLDSFEYAASSGRAYEDQASWLLALYARPRPASIVDRGRLLVVAFHANGPAIPIRCYSDLVPRSEVMQQRIAF